MWHGEFRDPRVAALYDVSFGWTRADDFFLGLVDETPGARVADLGCGTGRLTLALAAAGHTVTGVDPARASLDLARAKPGADAVRWVEGTSRLLDDGAYDVVVMTSHVVQFVVTDEEWVEVLGDLHRALVPGGRVFFDTRNPADRAWEHWNPDESRNRVDLPDGTSVGVLDDITDVVGDTMIEGTTYYRFADGIELTSRARMRWRSEALLRQTLADAGFAVEQIYGGWAREPVGSPEGELLVLARRRPDTGNSGT